MWPVRPFRPLLRRSSWVSSTIYRHCFVNATPALNYQKHLSKKQKSKGKGKEKGDAIQTPSIDHKDVGISQSLWTLDPSSPGSPFFLPAGTHVIQKFKSFLRAQYPAFGFQEVLSPTLYKTSLWKQSGHWENYRSDMFCVQATDLPPEATSSMPSKSVESASGIETYGLKPMNCPGHCIMFANQHFSYRDLPVRYADFSPLHRDEVSGALTGLTRVRRFHQDDGHIFCRPDQVGAEIQKCIEFTKLVYDTFGLSNYRFVLSTRPTKDYIGTEDEWDRAESQLKKALNRSAGDWQMREGDGAFYGPKIDMILEGVAGKMHQMATIQLDFQLPKRFNLKYKASGKKLAENKASTQGSSKDGIPVMIHRAIFGSLERFMALFIEAYGGQWPFWLNPHQVIILTVTNDPLVQHFATEVQTQLAGAAHGNNGNGLPRALNSADTGFRVELDDSNDTLNRKIARVKAAKKHSVWIVIGEKNQKRQAVDVEVSNIPNQGRVWEAIEAAKPGSRAPKKQDTGTGLHIKGNVGVRLTVPQLMDAMKRWTDNYL